MIAYHLSPEPNIRRFDMSRVGSGLGTTFYGAGIYLTFDQNVIKYYADQILERPLTLYTVEIPEEKVFNEFDSYLEYNSVLGMYADLVERFKGNETKASREMVRLGISAMFYNSPEDGKSIVVYDPKILKIVKKEQIF